ncbi:MAG: hypothetical protein K8R90_10835 [Candidatus Cloacimonetes bacterium]|nr:hypothetical protein [Candidatus Cloacimonadota bacterium]
MKRLIVILLVLLLVFFAGDRIISLGLHRMFYGSEFRFARLYRGGMTNEVIIMGNSRGKAYYTPYMEEKLGVSCFNLAYDAVDTKIAGILFADYLDHNAAPRLLIIEMKCLQGENKAHEGSMKVFIGSSERFSDFLRAKSFKEWVLCKMVHIYRYNSEFFLRAQIMSSRQADQSWVNSALITQAILDDISQGRRIQNPPPPRERYEELAEILRTASEHGVAVRLVLNPYLPQYVAGSTLLPYETYLRDYTGISEHVWDYRLAITDSSLFADGRHINVNGSRVLIDMQIADGFYDPVLPQKKQPLHE